MPSVGFWSEDTIETVHDFVLVRQDNFAYFLDLTKRGELRTPQKIFVVAPNGYGLEDLLCLYVLGEHLTWDIATIESNMPDLQSRYGTWLNLVQSLVRFDHPTASLCISEFARLALPEQSRTAKLVGILNDYVGLCVQPLAEFGIFRTFDPDNAIGWWEVPNQYGTSLSKFRQALAPSLLEMPGLKALDNAAYQAAKQWSAMAGRPTADKFFDLSAFCFGLAERYVFLRHFQWAFLLAYRSLDLYFQQLGLRAGILIEKADGIGYATISNKVHLVDVEHALFQEQALASSDTRRDFLVLVNRIRNQLLVTHGAHHVTETEVAAIVRDTADLVFRVESSTKWRQRSTAFFPPIQQGLRVLFESVPDINTFLDERTGELQPT